MEQKINKIITIPNILSFFRICLLPVIVWLYSVKHNYIWTGYVLILSGITDIADGYIARRFHMVSNLGKILDPVADKLTQGVMLLCLVLRFPLMVMPFVLMIAKEIFMGVSGIRIIQRTGIVCGRNSFCTAYTWNECVHDVLRIYCAAMGIFGAQIACQMTFNAIGNAKASIMVAVMRKFILLLPLIYILPHMVADKTMGVYLAEPVADVIAVLFTVVLFSFQFWKAVGRD